MLIIKRFKAFTIAEMIIVLVLSGIVISIAMSVLGMVQKQINGIHDNIEKQTEIRFLERVLWMDFNDYRLYYDQEKDILICYSEMDTVAYKFYDDFIIRNRDTLSVSVRKKDFYLDAEEVEGKTIDAMELYLTKDFQNKEIFIYQNKDASYYMNFN